MSSFNLVPLLHTIHAMLLIRGKTIHEQRLLVDQLSRFPWSNLNNHHQPEITQYSGSPCSCQCQTRGCYYVANTMADKVEEKKKESKTTNLRKKLSFKKSFSFLRKKAAKEAKKDEEEKKEGDAEKKEGEDVPAAETTEENKDESKVEEPEKKDEEKEVKDTEDKAPEVPTEAPPGKSLLQYKVTRIMLFDIFSSS